MDEPIVRSQDGILHGGENEPCVTPHGNTDKSQTRSCAAKPNTSYRRSQLGCWWAGPAALLGAVPSASSSGCCLAKCARPVRGPELHGYDVCNGRTNAVLQEEEVFLVFLTHT